MYKLKNRGFALFECMLALIIMALIALVITNYYQGVLNQRKVQQTVLNIRSIFSGIFVYHVNEGKWPDTIQDVINDGYITDKLAKNIWGVSYNYNLDESHQLIQISTCLPTKGMAGNVAISLPMSEVITHSDNCKNGVEVMTQMSYLKDNQSLKSYIVEADNLDTQKIPKPECNAPDVAKIVILPIQSQDQFTVENQSDQYWMVSPKVVSAITDKALINTYCGTNAGVYNAI